jgi:hypothetical protein
MSKTTVIPKQSLLDIAIQRSGSATAALDLARTNDLELTDALTGGQELETVEVVDQDMVDFYELKKVIPGTAVE